MKYRTRTFYSASQKAMMWERWKKGETLQQIAKLFDRAHDSLRGILAASGGIRPAVCDPRSPWQRGSNEEPVLNFVCEA